MVTQRLAGPDRDGFSRAPRRSAHELRPRAAGRRTPSSSATRSRTPITSSSSPSPQEAKEHELETALLNDVQSFLMEMGRGFALAGRQFPLRIIDEEKP